MVEAILLEDGVYNKPEHRQTLVGILYRLLIGCTWLDLSECIGFWNTLRRRFLVWSRKGTLIRSFKSLAKSNDTQWAFMQGSYVKGHQHSTGVASKDEEAIVSSRSGNTSKIHLAAHSDGLPIEYIIISSNVHDSEMTNELFQLRLKVNSS